MWETVWSALIIINHLQLTLLSKNNLLKITGKNSFKNLTERRIHPGNQSQPENARWSDPRRAGQAFGNLWKRLLWRFIQKARWYRLLDRPGENAQSAEDQARQSDKLQTRGQGMVLIFIIFETWTFKFWIVTSLIILSKRGWPGRRK